MNYEIREMLPKDGERVLEIFREGILGGNATLDKNVPTWEVWNQKFLKVCRLVLEDENEQVVGWTALKPISTREYFKGVAEVSLYLANSVQGKGLGSILMQKLILNSEENNFWMLQSMIFPENQASISVNLKCGFRIVGTREKIGQLNGVWRNVVLLERRSKNVN